MITVVFIVTDFLKDYRNYRNEEIDRKVVWVLQSLIN